MGREKLDVRDRGFAAPLMRHVQTDPRDREASLIARLASVERAYEELNARLRRYEQERAIIRERLGRLLASLGAR